MTSEVAKQAVNVVLSTDTPEPTISVAKQAVNVVLSTDTPEPTISVAKQAVNIILIPKPPVAARRHVTSQFIFKISE